MEGTDSFSIAAELDDWFTAGLVRVLGDIDEVIWVGWLGAQHIEAAELRPRAHHAHLTSGRPGVDTGQYGLGASEDSNSPAGWP